MKKKKGHKGFKKRYLFIALLVILGCVAAYVGFTIEEPPVKEMEKARKVLSEAENLDAEVYSRTLYRETKSLYDSAMNSWKLENEKWIIFRRFERTVSLAGRAVKKGEQAVSKAKSVRLNTKDDLREEIDRLRNEMSTFERVFAILPLNKSVKDEHSKGKLLLNAAEIAFEKGEYTAGMEKSHLAAQCIGESYRNAREVLKNYFKNLPRWQEELKDAIQSSVKKGGYAIVIEKFPPRCLLYYKGVEKYSFPAEFGRNWMGDKQMEGDYATPEGEYTVVRKMQGGNTRYYKALLLNYPNTKDKENFRQLKKKGAIPAKVGIGGLIEIHGDGGRGANWTNGCAALDNKDMDQLYKRVEKGVTVTIIGASMPLEEALKKF